MCCCTQLQAQVKKVCCTGNVPQKQWLNLRIFLKCTAGWSHYHPPSIFAYKVQCLSSFCPPYLSAYLCAYFPADLSIYIPNSPSYLPPPVTHCTRQLPSRSANQILCDKSKPRQISTVRGGKVCGGGGDGNVCNGHEW